MGCVNTREKIQSDMLILKIQRIGIQAEKKKQLAEFERLMGDKIKRAEIPDYITPDVVKQMKKKKKNQVEEEKNKDSDEDTDDQMEEISEEEDSEDERREVKRRSVFIKRRQSKMEKSQRPLRKSKTIHISGEPYSKKYSTKSRGSHASLNGFLLRIPERHRSVIHG